MKIGEKIAAVLFSVGLISGVSNAQDISNNEITVPAKDSSIVLSEGMNEQISFERHLNTTVEPFNDNVGSYENYHYSHTSHSSHYSHYSSRY